MPKKRYTPEVIIQHLRTVELDTSKGLGRARRLSETWDHRVNVLPLEERIRGLRADQAKRLKGLEQKNLRLKRIVADQALDLSILKEVAEGNF